MLIPFIMYDAWRTSVWGGHIFHVFVVGAPSWESFCESGLLPSVSTIPNYSMLWLQAQRVWS